MAVEGRGITQLTALVKPAVMAGRGPAPVTLRDVGEHVFHVIGGVTASDRRPDSGRNRSNPAARQVSRSPDFNDPAAVARAPGL